MKFRHVIILFLILVPLFNFCRAQPENEVKIKEIPSRNKVEVRINNAIFTSYIWSDKLKKPVLYPIHTSSGTIVTRGFPLDPRPGERPDHPHHVGHWLNYGDINGLDFWNNSYKVPEKKKKHYGTVQHERIKRIESNKEKGILEIEASWRDHEGNNLLKEDTRFIFYGDEKSRSIERHTTLTATSEPVNFNDNKEGFFAIRMAREFEFPTDKPLKLINQSGEPSKKKIINNKGVNGQYLSSKGITGPDVWGTRAKWMSLSAEKDGEKISVVIMDHPDNPGYPTYWHARTYGLFSANPLGQAVFSGGENELNFKLDAGESVEFKYKIYIKSGDLASNKELEEVFEEFAE